MPVAKPKASTATDVMKTEDKIDTIIKQEVGRESLLYFPRARESSIQWIPLLHTLDQPGVSNSYSEFLGWPFLFPLKVQLQKCEKCPQEFCSSINYRRHTRVHHRFKKLDKDSTKTRDLLGAYWDKLSVEEAKEVVSFENVVLEDVPGSSIIKALMSLTVKQGFPLLPQYYLSAGAALLDIVQSEPSSFPISSQELFSILDDASEKTCLCATEVSTQRYIFDGDAGKIGLEPRNVIACTSFLLEQKLVKAWFADKDAEALRCQKQLVEEEEAAQKRQAEILERKRQKKLRQKEQKAREKRHKEEAETKGNIDSKVKVLSKEQRHKDEAEIKGNIDSKVNALSKEQRHKEEAEIKGSIDSTVKVFSREKRNSDEEEIKGTIDSTVKAFSEAEASLDTYNFADNAPSHVPFQCPDTNEGIDGDTQSGHDFGTDQNIENSPIPKLEVIQKHETPHDQREAAIVNGSKAWSQKPKPEIDRVVLKPIKEKEPDFVKNREVLIGSISINLGNCSQSEGNVVASRENCMVENVAKQNSSQTKPMKPDLVISGNNPVTVKISKTVSRLETEDPFPVQSGGTEVGAVYGHGDFQNLSGPSRLRLSIDDSDIGFENNISHLGGRLNLGSLRLSSHAAKAFLAKRWKEALSSDHVKLVVSLDSEPPGCEEIAACQSSDLDRCNILANAENRLPATSGVSKSKPRMKSKKRTKT